MKCFSSWDTNLNLFALKLYNSYSTRLENNLKPIFSDGTGRNQINSTYILLYGIQFNLIRIFCKGSEKNWISVKCILLYGIQNNYASCCCRYEDKREWNVHKMEKKNIRVHVKIYLSLLTGYFSASKLEKRAILTAAPMRVSKVSQLPHNCLDLS